jgi:sugar-specific transcriptional regulator TrmB
MKEDELTGREVARRCELTPARTHAVLKEIAGEGLVRMRVLGRNHMYRLNHSSIMMPSVRMIFDPAYSAESHLKKIALEELADKRVLSAMAYGDRMTLNETASKPLRIMIIAESETAKSTIARKTDNLRDKINSGLGETPGIRLETIDELRSQIQKGDSEMRSALESHVLLCGESPNVLTSDKWRAQRFRFPLFRRS